MAASGDFTAKHQASCWGNEQVLHSTVVMDAQPCEYAENHELYALKC